MFILCYYLCRCFFLTMQSYDVFLPIPRKILDSSQTRMDKCPIYGQIAETGQKVVQNITRKLKFIWFFARFVLPLTSSKVLSFENAQINLAFYSLICNFASKIVCMK